VAAHQVDLRDPGGLKRLLSANKPLDGVFHLAAILAHVRSDRRTIWETNVDGTAHLLAACREAGVPKIVFTSTNCVFGEGFEEPVKEFEPPCPIEHYGASKVAGEKLISDYGDRVPYVILRCPPIISAGRVGLLSILFDFIRENRRILMIGGGHKRYQLIYAADAARACIAAMEAPVEGKLYHVGSDDVPPLRGAFEAVIRHAGSSSRIVALPPRLSVIAMRAAYRLGVSPLGPYHYRMLGQNFEFDTSKIKAELGWSPSRTNGEMLIEAFDWYMQHRGTLGEYDGGAANLSRAKGGIIELIRLLS
jgi:nucleoside-diphosphate-sugar epimerase